MAFCPQCGTENPEAAAFCSSCGTRLLSPSVSTTTSRSWVWLAVVGGLVLLAAVATAAVALFFALREDDDVRVVIETPTANTPSPEAPTDTPRPTPTPRPTRPPPTVPQPQGFATPEDAIADYFDDVGIMYIGDCASADIDVDAGKYCTILWDDRQGTQVYQAGPTFSEPDTWLLVERLAPDDWVLADIAELSPGDTGPPW